MPPELGPTGYQWTFVALEYYALILNRTYKVFVTDDHLCGAIVRGPLPSPVGSLDAWYDPDFYPRERLLRRYAGLDVHSRDFARVNYWNFQWPRSMLADVKLNMRPKWGMGRVPYSGRLILHLRRGGSQELILLGVQDGPTIRDRLRPLHVGARSAWWQRLLPGPAGLPDGATNAAVAHDAG